eukprot:359188-Chlamydomonas_euryale.AAC.26
MGRAPCVDGGQSLERRAARRSPMHESGGGTGAFVLYRGVRQRYWQMRQPLSVGWVPHQAFLAHPDASSPGGQCAGPGAHPNDYDKILGADLEAFVKSPDLTGRPAISTLCVNWHQSLGINEFGYTMPHCTKLRSVTLRYKLAIEASFKALA